jgi:cytidyltransferase-like protein
MTRVLTTGVFDLLHLGHVRSLQKAKAFGEQLIVGVSYDEDVALYKRLPIIPFDQRVELLRALKCVDEVVECPLVIDEHFYNAHRIDLHCQGDDSHPPFDFYSAGRRLGILRVIGRDSVTDTTSIIKTIGNRIQELLDDAQSNYPSS